MREAVLKRVGGDCEPKVNCAHAKTAETSADLRRRINDKREIKTCLPKEPERALGESVYRSALQVNGLRLRPEASCGPVKTTRQPKLEPRGWYNPRHRESVWTFSKKSCVCGSPGG